MQAQLRLPIHPKLSKQAFSKLNMEAHDAKIRNSTLPSAGFVVFVWGLECVVTNKKIINLKKICACDEAG